MSNAKRMAATLMLAGTLWLLPLQSAAQALPDGQGVTVNPGAPLLHRTPVNHPGGPVTGTVVLDATLSATGEVTDARVISGPEELRKAVLANVLNWHYTTQPAPPTSARVTVTFAQAGTTPPPLPSAGGRGGPAQAGPRTVSAIRTDGLSQELAQLGTNALGVTVGDTLPPSFDPAQKLNAVDEHLRAVVIPIPDGPVSEGTVTIILALATSTPNPQSPVNGQQRVSSGVARGLLIKQVAPNYPPIAKQARVQGAVLLSVIIGKEGNVKNINVVSGPAMLRQAALDAVQQWVYKPMLLNGQPIEVLTEVEINFALADPPKQAQ